MAELNFEVTGIDPDPYFIVIAKHHQERNKLLVGKKLKYVFRKPKLRFVKTK